MFFQILPYLDQQSVHDGPTASATPVAVPTYFCPTRRGPSQRDDGTGALLGLNDYATPLWKNSSEGAGMGGNSPGCWNMWSDAVGDEVNHPYYKNTVFVRGGKGSTAFSPGRWSDLLDGTSQVIMVAEKFVDPSRYQPSSLTSDPPQPPWPPLGFTDMGYYQGWNWSTVRCSMYGPVRDQRYGSIAYWQMFGSAHASGVGTLMADGSVRSTSFTIRNAIFQLLCRKDDGVDLGSLLP